MRINLELMLKIIMLINAEFFLLYYTLQVIAVKQFLRKLNAVVAKNLYLEEIMKKKYLK